MKRLILIPIITAILLALHPSAFVQAQTKSQDVCLNETTGDVRKPSSTDPFGVCGDAASDYGVISVEYDTAALSLCTFKKTDNGITDWGVAAAKASSTGSLDCSYLRAPLEKAGYTNITIKGPTAYASLATYGSTTTTPTTPGTQTPTPTTPKPTTPKPTTPTSQNPTGTPPPSGGQTCETGFKPVGPLCVPEIAKTNNALINTDSVGALATSIIRILLYFAGIIAVIYIIIGGYYIMTARGNDTQFANGRKTLVNAIIGLIIVILAYVIVQAITSFILR